LPNLELDAELNVLEIEASHHPRTPVIVMGDLNVDLNNIDDACSIAIATTMQHLGVIDCFHRFPQKKQRQCTRHHSVENGPTQRSCNDYAMVDATVDVRSLRLVILPRFHSDHLAIKLQIRSSMLCMHRR